MSVFKKAISVILAILAVLSCIALPISAEPIEKEPLPVPSVSAKSAILMLASTGEILYQKDCDVKLPMASTTKIMTALVALELGSPKQMIAVSPEAVGVEGSSIYLTAGEQLSLEQLLYALLLESANDAAVAIACGLSGSVDSFAKKMNEKADSLGLVQTHFTNPHGLDHEEHYTTARELAIITQALLKDPLLRTIVSTRKTTIPHDGTDSVRLLVNHNKMLRLYDGCIGVKTGFTKRSGRCLVSAAERDGVELIAVTLNASDDWNDHTALLNYGFSRYDAVKLCNTEEYLFPLPVVGGTDDYVMIGNTEALQAILPVHHGSIVVRVEAPRFAYADVSEGDVIGSVIFLCDVESNGSLQKIGEVELTARYSVKKKKVKRSFWQWLKSLFGFH
ncbi:MAG: D-alanyl-D-alanine carboxypeptidase [Ruminococcaceae bacterium]|nr:D-alanyl-D-alanine carboxypeptidase [Oscillospiraceae bacterium]